MSYFPFDRHMTRTQAINAFTISHFKHGLNYKDKVCRPVKINPEEHKGAITKGDTKISLV